MLHRQRVVSSQTKRETRGERDTDIIRETPSVQEFSLCIILSFYELQFKYIFFTHFLLIVWIYSVKYKDESPAGNLQPLIPKLLTILACREWMILFIMCRGDLKTVLFFSSLYR